MFTRVYLLPFSQQLSCGKETQFLKSEKGREKAFYNGHLYEKNGSYKDTIYWLCERRGDCKARLLTRGTEHIIEKGLHSHLPDPAKIPRHKCIARLKARASTTMESTHVIISAELAKHAVDAAATFTKIDSIKRTTVFTGVMLRTLTGARNITPVI